MVACGVLFLTVIFDGSVSNASKGLRHSEFVKYYNFVVNLDDLLLCYRLDSTSYMLGFLRKKLLFL